PGHPRLFVRKQDVDARHRPALRAGRTRVAGHDVDSSYSALISTLRNLITPLSFATPAASLLPSPCCSAITPLACLLSFPSTVFLPFSTMVKVSPLAVISYTFHWPTDFGIGSTLATPTIAPVA